MDVQTALILFTLNYNRETYMLRLILAASILVLPFACRGADLGLSGLKVGMREGQVKSYLESLGVTRASGLSTVNDSVTAQGIYVIPQFDQARLTSVLFTVESKSFDESSTKKENLQQYVAWRNRLAKFGQPETRGPEMILCGDRSTRIQLSLRDGYASLFFSHVDSCDGPLATDANASIAYSISQQSSGAGAPIESTGTNRDALGQNPKASASNEGFDLSVPPGLTKSLERYSRCIAISLHLYKLDDATTAAIYKDKFLDITDKNQFLGQAKKLTDLIVLLSKAAGFDPKAVLEDHYDYSGRLSGAYVRERNALTSRTLARDHFESCSQAGLFK